MNFKPCSRDYLSASLSLSDAEREEIIYRLPHIAEVTQSYPFNIPDNEIAEHTIPLERPIKFSTGLCFLAGDEKGLEFPAGVFKARSSSEQGVSEFSLNYASADDSKKYSFDPTFTSEGDNIWIVTQVNSDLPPLATFSSADMLQLMTVVGDFEHTGNTDWWREIPESAVDRSLNTMLTDLAEKAAVSTINESEYTLKKVQMGQVVIKALLHIYESIHAKSQTLTISAGPIDIGDGRKLVKEIEITSSTQKGTPVVLKQEAKLFIKGANSNDKQLLDPNEVRIVDALKQYT